VDGHAGEGANGRRRHRSATGPLVGLGRLTDPLRILIGNRSLTWLVIAFAGVTIAEWGYVTALAVDAFRQHGAIAVGLVGLRLFFAAVGSFVSIPYVDEHRSGRALTGIAGTRAAIVATSAGLAASGAPLTSLLVLVALDAIVAAPYRPIQSAMVPTLARTPEELAASAAAISTVKTLSQALGAILGGFLLVVMSPAFIFSGAALILVGAAWVTMRFRFAKGPVVAARASAGIRQVAHDTFTVVRDPHVTGILIVSGLRTFVRGMWIAIAVIASLRLFHAGSAGVGLLMLAAGIGSLIAVPLSATLIKRPRLGTPAALALIACGMPLGLVAGVPLLDVALVLVVAWGIGMAVADVATLSVLYRLLAAPLLPRVTATIESAKLALEGLGAFLAPVLVTTIGVRGALIVAALPLPVVVLTGWKALHRVDASASARSQVLGLLHRVPCLQPLDMAALDSLAGRVMPVSVPAGTDVVRQADHGDRFYMVVTGTAEVLVDGFLVGALGPGESFGEKALLRDVPRTATVRSCEPMQLLALSREDFLSALTGQQTLGTAGSDSSPSPGETGWSKRQRIELLSRVSLLSHLDSHALGELADRSVVDRWPQGATIVRRGDEGDQFFVLLDGRAVVSVDGDAVNELEPGDQFGEIALLHKVPRQADVAASSPVVTLSLHREDFLPAVRSRMISG